MVHTLTSMASMYSAMPGSSNHAADSTTIATLFLIIGVIGACFYMYWGLKTLQVQRSKGRQIQWYKLSSIVLPSGLLIILLTYFLRTVANPFIPHLIIDVLLIMPFLIGIGTLGYGIYLAISSIRAIS